MKISNYNKRLLTWASLSAVTIFAAIAFPVGLDFARNGPSILFPLKKTIAIWKEGSSLDIEKIALKSSVGVTKFEDVLEKWVEESGQDEERLEAKNRFLIFFKLTEKDVLDLSGLHLRSLPDIFNDPCFSRLKCLSLSNNQLIILPPTFSRLKTLKLLHLSHNQLSDLSDAFANLQSLEHLQITDNRLTFLPKELGNLQSLKVLNLKNNQLVLLPNELSYLPLIEDINLEGNQFTFLPKVICELQSLVKLNLKGNQLSFLPNEIQELATLKNLNLEDNQFVYFPKAVCALEKLKILNFNNNNLATVPAIISNCVKLKEFCLSNNRLTNLPNTMGSLLKMRKLDLSFNSSLLGIPLEIMTLPNTCLLDLTGCSLSQGILNRLQEITNHPDYEGPRISFSISDRSQLEEKSIEDSLNTLHSIINRAPIEISNLKKTPTLRSWLHRLSDIADYQKQGDLQKAFIHKIIEYIEKANENQEFRDIFYIIIEEASRTCGDRMALSILDLGISYALATFDLKDMKALADFLIRGPWTIEMLKEIASKKISTLPFFDEIEVYLGYPVMLKKELHIPIDVQEMLFFSCSSLQDKDLQEAKSLVLQQRKNEEARFEFLINHDKWKEALSINYPAEFTAIEKNRENRAKTAVLPEDYMAIQQKFDQELIKLTICSFFILVKA